MSQNLEVVTVDATVTSQAFLDYLQAGKVVKFNQDARDYGNRSSWYRIFQLKEEKILFCEKYPEGKWQLHIWTLPLPVFDFLYALSDHVLARHHIVAFTMIVVQMEDQFNQKYTQLTQMKIFNSKKKAGEHLGISADIL